MILPRPDMPTARLRALAELLDPLTARVRQAELLAMPAAIDPTRPEAGLDALLEHLQKERVRLVMAEGRREELQRAGLTLTEQQRPAFVVEQLRQRGARRSELASASQGRLDLPCLLEREGARVEEVGVGLELGLRMLPGLAALALKVDEAAARRQFSQSGAMELCLALGTTGARRPTRLAALRAVQGVLSVGAVPLTGMGEVQATLQHLCEDEAEDIWVRRAALRCTEPLDAASAAPLLAHALAAQEGPDAALLRALAARLALGRADWPAGPFAARLAEDPSETVRFAIAEGLAARLARGVGTRSPWCRLA